MCPSSTPSAPGMRSARASWPTGSGPAIAAPTLPISTRSPAPFASASGSAPGPSAAPARIRRPLPTSGLLDRQHPVHLVGVDGAPEGIGACREPADVDRVLPEGVDLALEEPIVESQ